MTKTLEVPVAILQLMRNGLECICVHHQPNEYHDASEPCPVLEKIDALLSAPVVDEPHPISKRMEESGELIALQAIVAQQAEYIRLLEAKLAPSQAGGV